MVILSNFKDFTFLVLGLISWYSIYHSIWVGENKTKSKMVFGIMANMCFLLIFNYTTATKFMNEIVWLCLLNIIIAENDDIVNTKWRHLIYGGVTTLFFIFVVLFMQVDLCDKTIDFLVVSVNTLQLFSIVVILWIVNYKHILISSILFAISLATFRFGYEKLSFYHGIACWLLHLISHAYLILAVIYKMNINKKIGRYSENE